MALLNQLWHKRRIGGAGFLGNHSRESTHSELSLINPCQFWFNRAKPCVFGLTEPIVTQCIGDVVPPPKPANALTDRFIMTGDSLRRLHHTYRVTLDAQHPTRTAHIPRSQSRTASTRDAPRARDVYPFLHARPRAQHAICGTMRRFNVFRAVVPQQCAPTAEANVFNPYRGNAPVSKTAETSHS